MKFLNKKSIIGLLAGVVVLAAAVSPFIVQAAADNNQSDRPAMHQRHFDPDKIAQRIADTYGVDKQEILNYNKEGIKFKDLSRASLLAKASGKTLKEVMTAKTYDNTWKDVANSLGLTQEQIKATRHDIAAARLEKQVNIPKQTAFDLMQQGYRTHDIVVANALSKNTGKSITDILALKKINNTWHDVANNLGVDDSTFKQDMKDIKAAFPHKGFHGFHGPQAA